MFRAPLLLPLLLLLILAAACGSATSVTSTNTGARPRSPSTAATKATPTPKSTPKLGDASPVAPADPDTLTQIGSPALVALVRLRVAGRAPMTGYSRDQFGPSWADVDGNGCDTRNDILGARLTRLTHRPGTHDCVVLSGLLADPYTGRTVHFRRGPGDVVDIDHVVSLGDAWQTGAQRLTPAAREALANDPLNLLAVDASSNRQKRDADAASWLPANKPFRCAYVARQVAVKTRYRLYVTRAERDVIRRILGGCPGQRLPAGGLSDVAGTPLRAVVAARNPTPAERAGKRKLSTPGRSVSYANCAAARAAGVTPLRRGSPGYSTRLDGDRDGVACE